MILKQYYLGCLVHASYLIADEDGGEAAVIDPQRDVEQYVDDARDLGCRIAHVFLTHFHADFVAGHLELCDRENATIHLSASAGAEFDFEPMGDGATVDVGAVRLEVLQTPGHSPESMSVLVYDPASDRDAPYAVLTGDTLFIGDVGRPDLRAALGWTAEDLGSMLYDSLQKFASLPDDTLVYPGHGAGSLCGKNLSTDTLSTMGVQRRYNYALQPMTRERFIEIVTADQPDTPAYFTYNAVLNTRERRTPGYLEGGARSLDEAPHLVERIERITAGSLAEQLASTDPPLLIDVRSTGEWRERRIEQAVNIPLSRLAERLGTVSADGPLVVRCASDYRATIAASLMRREGLSDVATLVGGVAAWESSTSATRL